MSARQDWDALRHTLKTWFWWSIAATVPVTLALIAVSEPLVRLLFERERVTPADTRVVSTVQSFSMLQLPSPCCSGCWSTWFHRSRRTGCC